ncbi:MAG: hypothetical protein ABJC62_13640 [Frankiaceae bacterium]|jgi:hypothetical protein
MSNLDRVRPRTPRSPGSTESPTTIRDAEGKRALFSRIEPEPVRGAITVACSRCQSTTSLTPLQALRAIIPSLYLPLLRRDYPALMLCPACRQVGWTRLSLHV